MEQFRKDAASGHPTAIEILSSQPKLSALEEWIFSAYNELSTDRPPDQICRLIPFSKITNYIEFHDVHEELRDLFISSIRIIDDFVVKKRNSSNK